jgi:hypothetical protein
MPAVTALGHSAIIVSWLFTGLTLISLALSTTLLLYARKRLSVSEWLNFAATITAIALVSQNTYAILIEGQSDHQSDLSPSQITVLAKVR